MEHCTNGDSEAPQREICPVKQHGRGRTQNSSFLTLGFINEEDSKGSFKPFTDGKVTPRRESDLQVTQQVSGRAKPLTQVSLGSQSNALTTTVVSSN